MAIAGWGTAPDRRQTIPKEQGTRGGIMNGERLETFDKLKNLLGIVFVVCGFCIAMWLFFTAYQLFNNPERLSPFQKLVQGSLESTLSGGGESIKFVIPSEYLTYFIPIALLLITGAVAGVLIKSGVKLVQSDLRAIVRRFDTFKHQSSHQIENLKEAIDRTKART